MVCDALALAAEPLGLREAVAEAADISLYLNLDDSLLSRLQGLRLDEGHEHYAAVHRVSGVSNLWSACAASKDDGLIG